MHDDFLLDRLNERAAAGALRTLKPQTAGIDFSSNDYLGIVRGGLLKVSGEAAHGSTGSRLLTGNYPLLEETEAGIAAFHATEAALIAGSGYGANLGLLGCIAGRGDTILYDALVHASIRDGLRLSLASGHSFRHNDVEDLRAKLGRASGHVFVVTESIFSMDGDLAPLREIAALCEGKAALIVDEAHATGVVGEAGEGLAQSLGLGGACFARVHTFGKALGCHGAAIVGSSALKSYLLNFARPFIYTTAPPPAATAAIREAYRLFPGMTEARAALRRLAVLLPGDPASPVRHHIVPGNEAVRAAAARAQAAGFDVRPILSPTVPAGSERLRIVLHAFNTPGEIEDLRKILGI